MSAQSLLEQTVLEHEFDIAIVSDQYRNLQSPYTWLADANKQAAIWILGGHQVQERPTRASPFFTWARVKGIYIFSIYAPPRLTDDEFAALLSDIEDEARRRRPLIVAGDFNAWSTEWGSVRTTHRGMVLLDALAPLDVVLFNTGDTPTFVGEQGQSIIDLTFASDELAQRVVSLQVGGLDTTSNHQAILYELEDARPPGPAQRRSCRWSSPSLNREAFQTGWGGDRRFGAPGGDGGSARGRHGRRLRCCDDQDEQTPPKRAGLLVDGGDSCAQRRVFSCSPARLESKRPTRLGHALR
uniref:Endonuclease/exonuclease/phosphatase domain-containing protein n=1 Tax=Trichogramma kaykai TaxID=54128 RepID=A0ABD2W709_9HYME